MLELTGNSDVNVICPLSDVVIDQSKPNLVILKADNTYSIVVQITSSQGADSSNTALLNSDIIKPLLEVVQNTQAACIPLPNMLGIADSEGNLTITKWLVKLAEAPVSELLQVQKLYQGVDGKIVGLVLKNISRPDTDNALFYVPCIPSTLLFEPEPKPVIEMLRPETAVEFTLKTQVAELAIMQPPIVINGLFIDQNNGILGARTQTDLFIPLRSTSLLDETQDIQVLPDGKSVAAYGYNMDLIKTNMTPLAADWTVFMHPNNTDQNRSYGIGKTVLESEFYNAYKLTIRHVLNLVSYLDKKESVVQLAKNPPKDLSHLRQIQSLANMLLDAPFNSYVSFDLDLALNTDDEKSLLQVQPVYNKTKEECAKLVYCGDPDANNTIPLLHLPKLNLTDPTRSNANVYSFRLADELIRYGASSDMFLSSVGFFNERILLPAMRSKETASGESRQDEQIVTNLDVYLPPKPRKQWSLYDAILLFYFIYL